jgi:hypothetical protein
MIAILIVAVILIASGTIINKLLMPYLDYLTGKDPLDPRD